MPEMQGMARPPGTRKERLFVGLVLVDVHSPWAVWVDCDADLGRTRLAARLMQRCLVQLVVQSRDAFRGREVRKSAGATLRRDDDDRRADADRR